jgi:hypothetical protein
MSITFKISEDEELAIYPEYFNGKFAELRFEKDGFYVTKWFFPTKINNVFSISENRSIHNHNLLEMFIKDIQNDRDSKYYRDDEVIFEYKDGLFIVYSQTMSTGTNLPLENLFLEICNKEQAIDSLTSLHKWLNSLV